MLRLAVKLSDRFGGGVWRWLNEEPLPVFDAALGYLGPLRAADDLARLSVQSLMNGNMTQWDFETAVDDLRERAQRLSGIEPEESWPTMEELAASLSARAVSHVEIVD